MSSSVLDEIADPLEDIIGIEGSGGAAFAIDSEESANWLLRKLALIEAETKLIQAQAEAITKRLTTQREGLLRRYGAELEQWAKSQITERHKSVQLLYGTCAFRKVPGGPKLADETAAMVWAHENAPLLLKVEQVTKLDRKAYLALVKEDGEILPGVEVVPDRESFSIKFKESE